MTVDEIDGYVLDAMLQSGGASTPVLVVNVERSTENTNTALPPVQVADRLELCQLVNHPWQVRSVGLGTFCDLQAGISWLLGKVN